jgi:hypothetical protein
MRPGTGWSPPGTLARQRSVTAASPFVCTVVANFAELALAENAGKIRQRRDGDRHPFQLVLDDGVSEGSTENLTGLVGGNRSEFSRRPFLQQIAKSCPRKIMHAEIGTEFVQQDCLALSKAALFVWSTRPALGYFAIAHSMWGLGTGTFRLSLTVPPSRWQEKTNPRKINRLRQMKHGSPGEIRTPIPFASLIRSVPYSVTDRPQVRRPIQDPKRA